MTKLCSFTVVKVTLDSRGGEEGKFMNTTLHKWIKHMHHESVIK